MKKIGILYICTGIYDVFWKDFYLSAEKYLLKGYELHYFVFTDSDFIFDEKKNVRIHRIFQDNLGWPGNTLMRFHMFLREKGMFLDMDYLYFFNANLEIKKEIGEEILPILDEIVVTKHPGFYNISKNKFTYDRNSNSTAFIKNGDGDVYIAGGLNGGKTVTFLSMCETLSSNIDTDHTAGIIAMWHDESHINKYILSHNYKLLDPGYLYPEGKILPFDCKILIRDKRNNKKFGNYYYQQGRTLPLFTKLLHFFQK